MQLRRKGYVKLDTRLTANTYRTDGAVTYIGLRDNSGIVTSEALIDTEDLELVKPYKWYRKDGRYVYGILNGKRKYLHRLITDCPTNLTVNHWNHNELDCRKTNLEICDQATNALYKRKTKGKYPYKGVEFRADCRKPWTASANIYRTRVRISSLNDMEEAAWVYDQIVMQLSNEYAYTNFDWSPSRAP